MPPTVAPRAAGEPSVSSTGGGAADVADRASRLATSWLVVLGASVFPAGPYSTISHWVAWSAIAAAANPTRASSAVQMRDIIVSQAGRADDGVSPVLERGHPMPERRVGSGEVEQHVDLEGVERLVHRSVDGRAARRGRAGGLSCHGSDEVEV